MLICICNSVTAETLTGIIKKNDIKTLEELQRHISVSNICGACEFAVEHILEGKPLSELFS